MLTRNYAHPWDIILSSSPLSTVCDYMRSACMRQSMAMSIFFLSFHTSGYAQHTSFISACAKHFLRCLLQHASVFWQQASPAWLFFTLDVGVHTFLANFLYSSLDVCWSGFGRTIFPVDLTINWSPFVTFATLHWSLDNSTEHEVLEEHFLIAKDAQRFSVLCIGYFVASTEALCASRHHLQWCAKHWALSHYGTTVLPLHGSWCELNTWQYV